jgi:hypothetical protein
MGNHLARGKNLLHEGDVSGIGKSQPCRSGDGYADGTVSNESFDTQKKLKSLGTDLREMSFIAGKYKLSVAIDHHLGCGRADVYANGAGNIGVEDLPGSKITALGILNVLMHMENSYLTSVAGRKYSYSIYDNTKK